MYYMPRQAILVTVTLDKDKNQAITVSSAKAEPDLSRRFVLKYKSSLVGTNHVTLSISSAGLLQTSNTVTTSGVNTIAKNIGADAGIFSGVLAALVPKQTNNCQANQTYTLAIYPENHDALPPLCNLTIAISPSMPLPTYNTEHLSENSSDQTGIFYRQLIPYRISITDSQSNTKSDYLAFSPDQSPTLFYPVSKSFFANNQTNIGLTDGIITSIDQNTDGELIGLTQLPADIISGYFSAIGNLFSQIGTATSNKATASTDQTNLTMAKSKLAVCQQVIATNSLAGKTGDDLTNTLTAIKAACQ
ncbi:hypothetical protein Bsp3421_000829 [Burkholderia sp. FERM BP-3421]|uniref:hypothetical protein n=1 Tax=Burkholderia sp. FERM BP-3421 TaxID=1494466 RepID=UPI0023613416|nr:hypothetical protein [Burkholderia sp. FERM BP-3421]WDD90943.1 hypothetical protein Bsp3421_000829 [Burkholderia sp. FERM BP-3421]